MPLGETAILDGRGLNSGCRLTWASLGDGGGAGGWGGGQLTGRPPVEPLCSAPRKGYGERNRYPLVSKERQS